MNTAFDGYAPYKGDIQYRKQGSLIAFETGESTNLVFSAPGTRAYSSSDQAKRYIPEW